MENTPLPEHSPAPSTRTELFINFCKLMCTVLRICVKLVAAAVTFFVALIIAMCWRN